MTTPALDKLLREATLRLGELVRDCTTETGRPVDPSKAVLDNARALLARLEEAASE